MRDVGHTRRVPGTTTHSRGCLLLARCTDPCHVPKAMVKDMSPAALTMSVRCPHFQPHCSCCHTVMPLSGIPGQQLLLCWCRLRVPATIPSGMHPLHSLAEGLWATPFPPPSGRTCRRVTFSLARTLNSSSSSNRFLAALHNSSNSNSNSDSSSRSTFKLRQPLQSQAIKHAHCLVTAALVRVTSQAAAANQAHPGQCMPLTSMPTCYAAAHLYHATAAAAAVGWARDAAWPATYSCVQHI